MTNSIGTKYHQEIDINGSGPLSIALRHINENTIILDVGCACGDMGIALKKYKNAQIYGLEYNQESVKLAQETKAYEEVSQFDLDKLNKHINIISLMLLITNYHCNKIKAIYYLIKKKHLF